MLFNSFEFLFCFLPLTWFLFHLACSKKIIDVAMACLVVASLFFYSYWNPPFVFLILFSILFNYSFGRIIERSLDKGSGARVCLIFGVMINLSLIAYFKYFNFFAENILLLMNVSWTDWELFLPLGISFFTFQQIAYLIDCYHGKAREHNFMHYALFVSFFPQLIAGPIVRYDEMIPQFENLKTYVFNRKNVFFGLTLLSIGLFKKVVIADSFSLPVSAIFDGSQDVTFFDSWFGALAYTAQIYFDFSGYSDMAIGLGSLFNIKIPINFNSPYKSSSIIDFWRRWHISLSTFLRDYLYIPLGGGHKGAWRKTGNLMVTMLLGGLWHGAAWMFVCWGGLHGIFLCINHLWKKRGFPLPKMIGWAITFLAVTFAWVLFRAPSCERALDIYKGMMGGNGVLLSQHYVHQEGLKHFCESLESAHRSFRDYDSSGGEERNSISFPCSYGGVASSKLGGMDEKAPSAA